MSGVDREKPWQERHEDVPNSSRRRFLHLVTILATAGSAAVVWANASKLGKVTDNLFPSDQKLLDGEYLSEQMYFYTRPFGPNDKVIVRKELDLSDRAIAGNMETGVLLRGREIAGPFYPSTEESNWVVRDGKKLGVWYEVTEGFELKTEDGELIKAGSEDGNFYIAGNFVRFPTEQESADLTGGH